jgi:PAP2 superfamily
MSSPRFLRTIEWPILRPSEKLMLGATAIIVALALVMTFARGHSVDWVAYLTLLATGGILCGLGLAYRAAHRNEDIATTLVSIGVLFVFTCVLAGFNQTLLPIWRAPIDGELASIDAFLGFSWPNAMAFFVDWPRTFELLRYAYISVMPQLAALTLVLGLSGRTHDLHVLMVASILTACMTVAIWTVIPSFGPSTIYELSPQVLQLNPIVGSGYGGQLTRLATEGPRWISPSDDLGLIAAPSYHLVMAVLAAHAARNLRWVRWPFFALNGLVIPATVVHGGHHLIDLIAGGGVVAIGLALAGAYLGSATDRKSADRGRTIVIEGSTITSSGHSATHSA